MNRQFQFPESSDLPGRVKLLFDTDVLLRARRGNRGICVTDLAYLRRRSWNGVALLSG